MMPMAPSTSLLVAAQVLIPIHGILYLTQPHKVAALPMYMTWEKEPIQLPLLTSTIVR